MKVRDAMTTEVRLVRPQQTIREAAQLMAQLDIGALPVEQEDRLVGMITDRDIAVRAVAQGNGPETPVSDVVIPAEINQEAWESLHSDTSRPFDKPKSGRIAVKVINHLGDEVMKVFSVK